LEADIISDCSNNTSDLTKEELVLLYLLENNNNGNCDDYIAPETATAQGIQKAVKCNSGYLSRILRKFENDGYIRRSKSKIAKKKRKQYAFYLTDKGEKFAEKLKINLSEYDMK
jgi:DNA-binding MarR family transcriptional regulator